MSDLRPARSWGDALLYIREQEKLIKELESRLFNLKMSQRVPTKADKEKKLWRETVERANRMMGGGEACSDPGISLCEKGCLCMTKTIKGFCGKCKSKK